MALKKRSLGTIFFSFLSLTVILNANAEKPRAGDLGIRVGILQPGTNNAITGVPGVRVGHLTLKKGGDIRTGVTAILPHGDNIFQEKVPAAIYVGNGFGKLAGSSRVEELGNIDTGKRAIL